MTGRIKFKAGAFSVFCLAIVMAGCTALPGIGKAPDLYNLTPKSTFTESIKPVDWQLVVEEPLASGGLDNNRIALRPKQTQLKYFADARWTERAPKMVQTLLIESFENTGKIVGVGRQAIGLRANFNLKTELREFQAEYFNDDGVPVVHVRMNAKIVRLPRQMIVASKTFSARLPAADADMTSIIVAFDDALGRVLKNLVHWALTTPKSRASTP